MPIRLKPGQENLAHPPLQTGVPDTTYVTVCPPALHLLVEGPSGRPPEPGSVRGSLEGDRTMKRPQQIAPAQGKLGVLLPGLGAVSTTFIAGCMLARRGLGQPFGSLTQLATIRLGKRTDSRTPKIKDFVPLAGLDQLTFGAWDLFDENAYES